MMGGMGRTFDGGYAEYTCVPAAQVTAINSAPRLGHARRGARDVPDRRTARSPTGSTCGPASRMLVRGGTSSVGMTAGGARQVAGAHRARDDPRRRPRARGSGQARGRPRDWSTTGDVARQVRDVLGDGVDAAPWSWSAPRPCRTPCDRPRAATASSASPGMLSNRWTVPDFYPIDYLPRGESGSPPTAGTRATCGRGAAASSTTSPAAPPPLGQLPARTPATPTRSWRPTAPPEARRAPPALALAP